MSSLSTPPQSTATIPAKPRLLIAASGTGGHLFPALAVADQLSDYEIEWLGVPNHLETKLVPDTYPLHTVAVEGFQKGGVDRLRVLWKLVRSLWDVRRLLRQGHFQGVFTTGGYIAAPAAIAARSLGLPVIFHESNALPGKVTRWLGPWCNLVAIGFPESARYLPKANTLWVGTPVRQQFLADPSPLTDLPIPPGVPLLAVVGGSQGALAINKVVRDCAPTWLDGGIWIVHQTGENDPDALKLSHPHYFSLPFYQNMAGLFNRADLVISRSGAGTLTELASTHTPSILVPYPSAADDHQAYNAMEFVKAGAAVLIRQKDLTPETLQNQVMQLLGDRSQSATNNPLHQMAAKAGRLAVPDSAERIADLIRAGSASHQSTMS